MKKKEREKIITLLASVVEAQISIPALIQDDKRESALFLLAQCQDTAITIGDMIEKSEGGGTKAVALLEEYCEIVFKLYQDIKGESGTEVNIDSNLAEMNGILLEETECIEKEIPLRKEVVFLPYKASMWDSFESIWMAACEDSNYDVYVIPIPYYDKNTDGSIKDIHYEGELFPAYVSITNYNTYSIEDNKPDLVFIHNPYDDANFVTSVYPKYYAKNLAQYTNCLVYIPYFVIEDNDPNDTQYLKDLEHLVLLPGVIHTHKTIVQSEKMRQAYVNILANAFGEETRTYWLDKIKGWGSPKVERVINVKKNTPKIFLTWSQMIEREDGSKRKVILYNTSIGALLEHREKMMEKIKSVFEYFSKVDDFVLVWRPHPLYEATIESMCPELLETYHKLVREYKDRRIGIFDDTADVENTIAVADGYYGDASSLNVLCHAVNIPVFIQDLNQTSDLLEEGENEKKLQNNYVLYEADFSMNQYLKYLSKVSADTKIEHCDCGKKIWDKLS